MSVSEAEYLSRLRRGAIALKEMESKLEAFERERSEPIAIIGMGCRFPGGASSPARFWQLLLEGFDAVTEVPAARWSMDALDGGAVALEHRGARWGAFLEDVDRFDASFFGISPREALTLDPQQRLLLEVTWEALEDAGVIVEELMGSRTGVFLGISYEDYREICLDVDYEALDVYAGTGNGHCFPPGRISYVFGLNGPSLAVDTACSSSLVTVHLACQSLRSGESTMVLAGGVNLMLTPTTTRAVTKLNALSPDGHCKAFDAQANGFVRGEGCGIVVLKRLSDALSAGDTILALIRGSAVNQDGRSAGLTAPNPVAQVAMLRRAFENARVSPSSISFIETHGTGTSLGDPIEIEALTEVLGRPRADGSTCALGAVKTNIGHLEPAAGIAGLIKTVLALRHAEIPPNIHFRKLNPRISLEGTPFVIPTEQTPWRATGRPRIAGVSSFGMSGTNAHVVLEEAPPPAAPKREAGALHDFYLLPLSARSPEALRALAEAHDGFLADLPEDASLLDICYTASLRRSHHEVRLAVVGSSRDELRGALQAFVRAETGAGVVSGHAPAGAQRRIAFVFSGQGSQWVGMGRLLLEREPVFRACMERCDALLRAHGQTSILDELAVDGPSSRLDNTEVTQPSLFAIQVSLVELWRSLGISPHAVIGHSVGEVAAAWAAGALSLEEAARIVAHRGRVMQRATGLGRMAAVELPSDEAEREIAGYEGRLSIASINSPTSAVLAGEEVALNEVVDALKRRDVFCRRLNVNYAFHSYQMEPLAADLSRSLQEITPSTAAIPIFSTVTGQRLGGPELTTDYWVRNMRDPVRFAVAMERAIDEGFDVFLEISPHPVLGRPMRQCIKDRSPKGRILASLRNDRPEPAMVLESLGALHTLGFPVDWRRLYPSAGRCVSLPAYRWQRDRYWFDAPRRSAPRGPLAQDRGAARHPLMGSSLDLCVEPETHVWEAALGLTTAPYLKDHRVQGAVVLPAAAYLEMALFAAEEVFGPGAAELSDLTFKQALFLPEEGTRRLQVAVTLDAPGTAVLRVSSMVHGAVESSTAWRPHAVGILRSNAAERPRATERVDEIRARCAEPVRASEHYAAMTARGLEYGPSFQCVTEIARRDGEAVARVCLPDEVASSAGSYRIHPTLLDACLQVLVATLPKGGNAATFMPVGFKRVRLFGRPGPQAWCHVRLHGAPEQRDEKLIADVLVLSDDGQVVLEAQGFEAQRLERSSAQLLQQDIGEWIYEPTWEPSTRASGAEAAADDPLAERGTWIIFADEGGVAAGIAERLSAHGQRRILVTRTAGGARLGDDHYQIDPGRRDAVRQVIARALSPGMPPCKGILHLWSLDARPSRRSEAADLDVALELGCISAIHLLQAVGSHELRTPPRLWLVTQGAQSAGGRAAPCWPAQATLWGFGRTVRHEYTALASRLVDLDPDGEAPQLIEQLWDELRSPDGEDQIALRAGQRFVARLERRREAVGKARAPRLRPDATYLITGGLGGIGLEVARWMVEQGARRLILMGRSELPRRSLWKSVDEASALGRQIAMLRDLEARGATVHLAPVDVADEARLASFLDEFEAEGWPEIRGVMHAAGVLDDRLIERLDRESFLRVLGPKVRGSWQLQRLFADKPLDFFVLFSSGAAVLGSMGQGSYAAANAFLDALAHWMRAQGRSALSIDWGAWAEVGMAARQSNRGDRLASQGILSMAPDRALSALGRLLGANAAQVAVMAIDWQKLAQRDPVVGASALVSRLTSGEGSADGSPRSEKILEALRSMKDARERRLRVAAYLRQLITTVLCIPESIVEPAQRLNTLGLDSLMAMELKSRIERDLEVALPMVRFLEGPSVEELTSQVFDAIRLEPAAPPAPTREADPSCLDASKLLSYGQRALWFIHKLAPESTAYNIAFAARIGVGLSVPDLRRAFQTLVDRHPPLRTTYVTRDGEASLRVPERMDVSFELIDASAWSLEQLKGQLVLASRRPLDLESGPVMRVHLFACSDGGHVMLLTVHHIGADFWSFVVLIEELGLAYTAHKNGQAVALPPLPVSYADFTRWQAEMLASEEGERHWAYWKEQLGGDLPDLDLTTDRPRPHVQTYRGASLAFSLSEELTNALKALARVEGTTVYTLLLTAFQVLLHRMTGQQDILVGSPASGRSRREFAPLIGYFVNLVVLRARFEESPTFRAVLARMHQTVLDAISHQDYPFPLVVERLSPPRDPGRSPIFQAVFVLQKPHRLEETASFVLGEAGAQMRLGDLEIESVALPERVSQFDLTLMMAEAEGVLRASLQYNTDLFDASTMQRLAGHFQVLLGSVVADPARPIRALPLLTPEERRRALVAWNATQADYPKDACLHDLFEEQARRSPEAVAVVFKDRPMSYRELNRRANQLGRTLRKQGARPNALVAVVLEKGWEQVVAVLAIHKAGAAYVPIDPNLPAERVLHLLQHGQVKCALTSAALEESLPWPEGVERLHVDAQAPTDEDDHDLDRAQQPGDLAYVIYTSGSTGLPKGVVIDHTGPVNTIVDINRRFSVGESDRVLAISALNFDLSVYDIFGMLAAGGAIITPEPSGARDPGYWADQIDRHRVTIWNSVPALMEMLVNYTSELPGARLSSLRAVLMSGDWIPVPLPDRIKRLVQGVRVTSLGGATEASIWSILYPIERVDPSWRSIPYGRPMDNQRFYVLDDELDPCPIGVTGALYIGGIGVAKGYWGDLELTRAVFIQHPGTGEQLYRTGDLGRYMADGNIEFLGRKDFQVKIRGFRIELGEIEATLLTHPTVREAAAIVHEDTPGDKRLVAYVVAREGALASSPELRDYLKGKLPEYMIPSTLMALDAMPLSTNGKVDRKALPAPERSAQDSSFVAPQSHVEEALAAIWAKVLGLEKVGRQSNFFALGGDSILAIQVVSRAQQAGIGLMVRQLFQHQTVSSLAAVATTAATPQAEQGLVTGPAPLTPIQRWFFERELVDPHHFNQAILLEVHEPLDPALLEEALRHLLRHHDALRLRFRHDEAGWYQHNAGVEGLLSLTLLDMSSVPAVDQAKTIERAAADVQASLHLEQGPMMQVALMDFGAERPGRLFLVAHHLVIDGVSWHVLLADLQTAYDQLRQGQPVRLPFKTTAFKQWAERLVDHVRSPALLEELPFWISPSPAPGGLPVDLHDAVNTVASARNVDVRLDPEDTRALLADVPEVYRTQINDVLLAALGLSLSPWIGARQIRLDLEGHGREEIAEDLDVSRTIGWFTSMFPVEVRLPEAPVNEVLKSVKEQLRSIPNRGFGHGLLRYLHPDPSVRDQLRAQARPAVLFNYLGQLDQMLAGSSRFSFAKEASGSMHSPRGLRSHLLEINGWVAGAELHLLWTYSEQVHHRATIEALANRMLEALRAIIAHCKSPDAGGRTPADFPLATLSQSDVDRLVGAGRGVEDIYRLSPTQLGMLFHTLRDPTSGEYVEQLTFRSPRGLDVEAFKAAWQKVIERHTIFRTSFASEGLEQPVQIVHARVPFPWIEHDWRELPADQQDAQLSSLFAKDRARGFDLGVPSLMRLMLIRLSDDAYQFVWSHHHITVDGWSLPLIFKELLGFYDAARRGEKVTLEEPRPYRDYIAWLAKQDVSRAEAYFREALRGFHAPTPLVVDRLSNTAEPTGRGHVEQALRLSAATTAALTELARSQGLTLNTLAQGAWALLLSRYSGEQDVVFGTTVSGRAADLEGIDAMVGIFINTLPVRVRLSPEDAVLPWLKRLQERQAEQLPHEYSPLAQVQRWSEIPRGQALFQSLLVLENYPMDVTLRQGRTSLTMVDPHVIEQTNYPLTVVFVPGEELALRINYVTELFDAATIERMLGHLGQLLEGVAAAPERRLMDLPLLPADERRTLLLTWNETALTYPSDLCMHELFEAQVERTPESIAVLLDDQRLTYRELNRRANRLARRLRALGVAPDTVVGLCLERSLEMVIGVFAVLKAGGAYVPLDPAYPTERLAFMIEDSRVPILLTEQRLASNLPDRGAKVLCLDTIGQDIDGESTENLPPGAVPDNAAYLIYTSGSTGKPKGVMISHRSIANHMRWMQTIFPMTGEDRILQKTAFSFDAAGKEIYAALLNGAQLVMARPEGHRDSAYLVQTMAEQKITFLQAVPSLLKVILEEEGVERYRDLKWVFCAGEALSLELTGRLFARLPNVTLVNTYGPTEAAIDVTYWTYPEGKRLRTIPIGQPMANTQAYVLDHRLDPAPIGVPGELHIAGVNLARGYLDRPHLTADKFIPDPFAAQPGARMYRTGDLCRWLPDGTLEFLGRIDHQIKLRGFRIELGEIEAALEGHPAVLATAVLVREDTPGVKRLVAYFVPRTLPAVAVSELRQFLGAKLPDYMVPAVFVTLEAMPLTPNGKIDRKALPAPDGARPELDDSFVAPASPVEEALAAVWATVLGLEKVGVQDNFFALGGDSILAMQVVSRAQQAGIRLLVRQLFQHPTVAALAAVATTAVAPQAEQDLVTGPVPMTPIQRWFFERELVDPHHFNQAVLLELPEPLDAVLLEEALQQLLRHHDALRLRFSRDEAGWQQHGAGIERRLPLITVHLSMVTPAEQARAIEATAAYIQAGLRLAGGPRMQAALMDLGPGRPGRLLIVAHHLVIDGVSWRILLEDLETAYGQLQRREAVHLPSKTTSFKQWAERLVDHARSAAVLEEIRVWASLTSEPALLPADMPGGANTVASARTVEVSLSQDDTRALLTDVPEAYRTQINDVLLAALGLAFAPWTGARRLRLDLDGHGREEVAEDLDVSRTVGWFTSMFPVELHLPDAPIGQVLQSVKEQLRRIPNRGFRYGLLRYLCPDPAVQDKLRALPRAEVAFNYMGQFDPLLSRSTLFQVAKESSGPTRSPQGTRSHLMDIEGLILGGQLRMSFTYSQAVHRRATVESLAQRMLEALRAIIAYCQSPEVGGRSPADFPLATLTQDDVNRLVGDGRGVEDIYPPSSSQLGILFHTLHDPGSGVYVEQLSFQIQEKLDVQAYKYAWRHVLARHAVLRARFAWEGLEHPVQIVDAKVELPWVEQDWRGASKHEREDRLRGLLADDRARGFDLRTAPLMRFTLIRLTDTTCQFVWSFHHLLMDGWSLPLIMKEMLALYGAARSGEHLKLPPVHPYREYIAWLQRQEISRIKAYWREALQGFHTPTPLVVQSAGDARPASASPYARQVRLMPAATTAALSAMARTHALTLTTIIQGACALLLSCYSGESDVVFGITVSGRSARIDGIDTMIGNFINTLPARIKLPPEVQIIDWLEHIQEQHGERLLYEHSPLAQVQGWSEVPRGQALFRTLLVIENYPVDTALREGDVPLAVTDILVLEQTNYPLTIEVAPGPELLLRILYDTALFDDAAVTRALGHLQTLLEGISSRPQQRLSELSLLTAEERHQMLVTWNDSAAKYPQDQCFQELFEAQVERTPDAIAAVFEDQRLTYRELDQRSSRLAHHLRAMGVGPDVLVAILSRRSTSLLIAILAVFKAGGAYLPLDPEHPTQRLLQVLEGSRAAHILVTNELMPQLSHALASIPAESRAGVCQLEALAQMEQPEWIPTARCTPSNLAYVIYTSGSTGVPKGAMVEHRGMLNHLYAKVRDLKLEAADAIAQTASQCFDISVWQFLSALLVGGRVHIVEDEVAGDPRQLWGQVESGRITILEIVPSLLRMMLEDMAVSRGARPDLSTLRWLIVTGEALPPELCGRWLKNYPSIPLLNAYGPTECSDDVAHYPLFSPPREGVVHTPIGRPIINTQLYVLDSGMRPVPVGVPGELYVGGEGVGRGYRNDPKRTSVVFLPDPFAEAPSARLYKTGDLVRYLPSGDIEFLGRIDHQVKIRGFRIELGEIEAVLGQHPAVREVVVLAQEVHHGNKRLVAYVVARESPAPATSELRHFLEEHLPEYMVPAVFVVLEAMPLTPNGKIDRKALPTLDGARPELDDAFVAPRTPTEEMIASVWSHVLGVERVGAHDNFFALGGDSIVAIQVIGKIQQAGIHLTMRQLFQHPTIAALAMVTSTAPASQVDQGLVTGPVLLTPIQHSFLEQGWSEPHHFNQAILLETREALEPALLEEAIASLLRHHDALRLRFVREGAGWRQFDAAFDGKAATTTVDLSAVPPEEQAQAVERAAAGAQASLRLDEGPLMRAVLMNLGTERPGRLVMIAHHLVIDLVSWTILLEDLHTAYTQRRRGEAIRLPLKTTSFQRWAERLSAHAQLDAVRSELPYWLGTSRCARLPVDMPGGVNSEASTETVEVSLSAEETAVLLREVPVVYNTQIQDLLLTALALAFASWTGAPALRVDIEGHGREEISDDLDLSRTVGWFTALYPVRLEIPKAPLGEILKAVKEQLRSVPERGIGYGLLRYLHHDPAVVEQLRALPPTEVSFNFLGQRLIASEQALSGSSLFGLAKESSGPTRSSHGIRPYLFEVDGWLAEGHLCVGFMYSRDVHRRSTVEALGSGFIEALRAIIAHCKSPDAGGRTPADFPLAGLSQSDLDRLVSTGRDVEDLYPLSPMQQGMLFHTLRDPSSGEYIEQLTCRLTGGLDVDAFKSAWRQLVVRHALLRTEFLWEGLEEPLQLVRVDASQPWTEHDLRALGGEEQKARIEALLAEDRARGFELERAPLIRLSLLRLGDDAYYFVWSFHHLLLDGWSLPLLFKELFGFYQAARRRERLLIDPPRPYRDYIAWLRLKDLSLAEVFWREALRGFSTPTSMVVDSMSRPGSTQTTNYRYLRRQLPASTSASIMAFTRAHGLTLNTLMQGAYALLLGRYSGDRDVLFGATVSGRSAELPGLTEMVGIFINTLPVRVQLPPDEPVLAWLKQIQAQQAERMLHEYTPLALVQGWSEVPRQQDLFSSLLAVENYRMDTALLQEEASMVISDLHTIEQTNYPLTMMVIPEPGVSFQAMYAGDLFEEATISRMMDHFQAILEGITTAPPERRLAEVPMLSEEERRRILISWNDTAADYPTDICLHQLFEAQVERTPEAIAVIANDRRVTYRELNRRANQLGRSLRQMGARPNMLVAVVLDKGWEQVVAVLAIQKSGAAYLPIDPGLPAERLRHLLEHGQVELALTSGPLDEGTPWPEGLRRLRVDEGIPEEADDRNLDRAQRPEDLAYVIYTSGSTGLPKGVMIDHIGAANTIVDINQRFEVGSSDRVLALSALNFDLSVYDVFGLLAAGGAIVMPDTEGLRDPTHWAEMVERERVTLWNTVPALMEMLVDSATHHADAQRKLRSLRAVLMSGDWIPVKLPDRIKQIVPGISVTSLGGATEASIWSILYPIERVDLSWRSIPYGRPMWNQRFYVLDDALEPCPVGVSGSLYIGGVGLAKGYWRDESITRAAFIEPPRTGERLYRTGDLGRYMSDGNIEFLGRKDFQVKIRGFRIELGEIEAALLSHPAVREAVAVVREDTPGNKRLVAYVVADEGLEPGSELRDHIKGKLPEYMIPSAIVALEAMPLSPNGKVDRRALPAPDGVQQASTSGFVAPRNSIEEALAKIWLDVLGVERVGIQDNFFELGGHSLLATQVASRVREAFSVDIPLRQVFAAPTLADLATLILDQKATHDASSTDLEEMLTALEGLSEEEAMAMLAAGVQATDEDGE